jgi:hypothetical protein
MLEMSRVRVTILLFVVSFAVVAGLLATTTDAASNSRAWTHRITAVDGELIDHWAYNDSSPCGAFGDGTVTVKFHFTKPKLVELIMDPYHAGNPSNKPGSWVVGIPGPTGGIRDMPYQPATGTISLVDNTAQHPGNSCTPTDKSDCGTLPLSRAAKSVIQGYNRHWLLADLSSVELSRRGGYGRATTCRIGQLSVFSERLAGGTPLKGELLMKMPSISAVKHRRVLTVVGTSHKLTSAPDCGSGATCSDDVTRRVSVTFKHL